MAGCCIAVNMGVVLPNKGGNTHSNGPKSHLDSPDRHIPLDYRKAFDRIGHDVLINKLINSVRRCFIPRVMRFLSNRRQCVKRGNTTSH